MTVAYRGDRFCVPKQPSIGIGCHDLGRQVGKWCVSRIETVEKSKTAVQAAGQSLDFISGLVGSIVGTAVGEAPNSIRLKFSGNGAQRQRVTGDRPPCRTARLSGSGVCRSRVSQPTRPKTRNRSTRSAGVLRRAIFECAPCLDSPIPDRDGHLVLTDGGLTGDWAVRFAKNRAAGGAGQERRGAAHRRRRLDLRRARPPSPQETLMRSA